MAKTHLIALVAFLLVVHAAFGSNVPGVSVGHPILGETSPAAYCGQNPFFNSGSGGQCTAFCWGRANEKLGISLPFTGNAQTWWSAAQGLYQTGSDAQPNSIAVWSYGDYGHVAFIEEVNGDQVTFNEANTGPNSNYDWGCGYVGTKTLSKTTMAARNLGSSGTTQLLGYIYLTPVTANSIAIPLTADSWDLFGWPGFGQPDFIATMTQAPDGIQFSGSGYRSTSVLSSKAQWDLTNATVYLKWQANGGGSFMAISPAFYPQNEYEYESSAYYGGSFSTGNQWGGTIVISENTWYYSRITFDAGWWSRVTATQNYDNQGGTIVQSYPASGPFSPTDLAALQHAHLGLELVDMYAGTSAWAKVGEALVLRPATVTIATPPNPNAGQRPTGLSGHLNYWDVAQNQWVSMTAVPSTAVFDASRPTIVITHGWRDRISNTPDWLGSDNWTMRMAKQAEAIANQNVNVLAWDWHANANPAGDAWFGTLVQNLFTNVQMIKDAAESAGRGNTEGGSLALELKTIGINPSQTQLIGHSNGGAVMGSAATTIYKLMNQKIQRLTTLDSPNITMLSVPVNATQYILHDYANEVEVYFSGDRLDLAFGAWVSGNNVFNGEVYPTGSPLNPEHSVIPDWYTNLGETATIPHAPAPNVRGMNWSIISPNRPSTWIAEDCNEQGANTGIFGTTSFAEQMAAKLKPVKQMNFYSGEEYQGLHAATINDAVRSYVANLWGNSDGYLFKTITIPSDAIVMTFDMKVVTVFSGDYITLCFGDKVIFCEDITDVDSNFVTTLPIPIPSLAGQTDTLLFTLHHDTDTPGSSVLLDNITFSAIRPLADLNNDLTVDFVDFAIFANKWSAQDCNESNGWCSGRDFDKSGTVDINDLVIFIGDWLWKPPKSIKADLNLSGAVDFIDFSLFANQWSNDCNSPDWCYGSDFDHSGSVDMLDLAEFAKYWLSGS